jgi:hypothetical protein
MSEFIYKIFFRTIILYFSQLFVIQMHRSNYSEHIKVKGNLFVLWKFKKTFYMIVEVIIICSKFDCSKILPKVSSKWLSSNRISSSSPPLDCWGYYKSYESCDVEGKSQVYKSTEILILIFNSKEWKITKEKMRVLQHSAGFSIK